MKHGVQSVSVPVCECVCVCVCVRVCMFYNVCAREGAKCKLHASHNQNDQELSVKEIALKSILIAEREREQI